MKKYTVATFAALIALATPAIAEQAHYATYKIKTKTTKVTGVILVGGFTDAEVRAFISDHCAAGAAGEIQYVGKPRKRRGDLFQKYESSCQGGPAEYFGGTRSLHVEREILNDGRLLSEFTYSKGGNLIYDSEIN